MHGLHSFTVMAGLILLLSCQNVVIKDSEWCGSLGASGAACFHTLTPAYEILDLQQFASRWTDLKNPLVCTDSSTLADWKADIEKLCSYDQNCTPEVQAQVNLFYDKLEAAEKATMMTRVKMRESEE